MKHWLLAILLLATTSLWATSGVISTHGTDCSTSTNCLVVSLPADKGGATFTLSGTWSATMQFESTGDGGTTWTATLVTPLGSTTAVTSATSNGTWQVNTAGFTGLRVRASALASGSATATITTSFASARSNGGGGSGGLPTGTGIVRVDSNTGSAAEVSGFGTTSGSNALVPGAVASGQTLTIQSGGTLTCAAGSTCPSSSPASGTPIVAGITCGVGASAGINGYSLWQIIPGNALTYMAATWKVVYAYYGGTGVSMHKSVVMKTARASLTVLSTTNITFSSSATYVSAFSGAGINAPFYVTSDTISLQLDNLHDYYIMTYYDTDGTGYNANLVTCEQNSVTIDPVMWANYEAGDQTGVTSIPAAVSPSKQPIAVAVQIP